MKKSVDGSQAVSSVLKYMLQILGLAFFYAVILYTTLHVWIPLFSDKFFSKVYYTMFRDNNIPMLLILYALFAYCSNNFLLKLYERGKTGQLLLSYFIDIFVLVLGLLLSILYNNVTIKSARGAIDDIYNIYIIMALLIIKEIIAALLLSKKAPAKS
jgi:hypothetical protein